MTYVLGRQIQAREIRLTGFFLGFSSEERLQFISGGLTDLLKVAELLVYGMVYE